MSAEPQPWRLDRAAFLTRFGKVFEDSPWVAGETFDSGLPADADRAEGLHRVMCATLRAAPRERQRALLLAHPDLAGRLAQSGDLSAESRREQAGAGLDRASAAELERFAALNAAYRERFGLPFIMAVKGRSKAEILEAFESRLGNDPETEFAEALAQVERIALLRLRELLP